MMTKPQILSGLKWVRVGPLYDVRHADPVGHDVEGVPQSLLLRCLPGQSISGWTTRMSVM